MRLGVVRNSVKPHKPGASDDFSAYVSFLALSRLAPKNARSSSSGLEAGRGSRCRKHGKPEFLH